MYKYQLDSLIKFAFENEPGCINDRLLLVTWVWLLSDHNLKLTNEFYKGVGKTYTYLLKHHSPDSIIREKEKILEKDPDLKALAKDTEAVREKIISGQESLPIELKPLTPEEARKRLIEARSILK